MKKILIILSAVVLLFSFVSCKKKEAPSADKGSSMTGPIIDSPLSPSDHKAPNKKTEFQVVVPDDVKKDWSSIELVITDKKEDKKEELTLKIGDELNIEGSSLTVKTGAFLPDFKMGGGIITSASSNPVNPALGIAVFEDGKQIFPESGQWGWIYKNFPTIHPFEHDRYGIALKGGVK